MAGLLVRRAAGGLGCRRPPDAVHGIFQGAGTRCSGGPRRCVLVLLTCGFLGNNCVCDWLVELAVPLLDTLTAETHRSLHKCCTAAGCEGVRPGPPAGDWRPGVASAAGAHDSCVHEDVFILCHVSTSSRRSSSRLWMATCARTSLSALDPAKGLRILVVGWRAFLRVRGRRPHGRRRGGCSAGHHPTPPGLLSLLLGVSQVHMLPRPAQPGQACHGSTDVLKQSRQMKCISTDGSTVKLH